MNLAIPDNPSPSRNATIPILARVATTGIYNDDIHTAICPWYSLHYGRIYLLICVNLLNDLSTMTSHSWDSIDQAHLLQKIILLQLLNRTPEKPSVTSLSELKAPEDDLSERILDLQREKELAESFAFLAATTDDPKKVVAACVEEGEKNECLTVRLAINNGGLDHVTAGFDRMAKIFERVAGKCSPSLTSALSWNTQEQSRIDEEQHALLYEAIALNQNRILVRLRSCHATLRCSFKKKKMQRGKVIPQLYKAINAQGLAQKSGVVPLLFTALKADVDKLYGLFAKLEDLTTLKAVSSPGLEILVQMVTTCQHVHERRILHQVLARSPGLDPNTRASITLIITKLSRYFSVSQFLLQAARKYPVFMRVRVSAVCFRAPNLPATELDSKTADLIHSLLDGPKLSKLTSKFRGLSSTAIEDHLCQEATVAVPVHAEVQLLFYYERNTCNMPPRIICSSKQACFLCDLFFKIHGRFTIPSTHGRLYEKWALPEAIKSMTSANGDILTKMGTFVSAIENALLRETQSARKSYPNPYESIILHSAVFSQSNHSTTSARGFISQPKACVVSRSEICFQNDTISRISSPIPYARKTATESGIDALRSCSETSSTTTIRAPSPSNNDTISRTSSPIPDVGKAATESRIDALRSCSEASSTTTIRAPSPSNTLPEHVISLEESTSSINSQFPLKKGQPIWQEISSTSHSFQVRTPHIHLTISQDELFCGPSQDISHDLVAGCGQYWLILEYLSNPIDPQDTKVPFVNLLDVPTEREMILDYGTEEWPRNLRVCSKDDVISITYSSRKPLEGEEFRT